MELFLRIQIGHMGKTQTLNRLPILQFIEIFGEECGVNGIIEY